MNLVPRRISRPHRCTGFEELLDRRSAPTAPTTGATTRDDVVDGDLPVTDQLANRAVVDPFAVADDHEWILSERSDQPTACLYNFVRYTLHLVSAMGPREPLPDRP